MQSWKGRHYGGGVLELVPSEIERLLIPALTNVKANVDRLDKEIRSLPMDRVLERQGKIILGACRFVELRSRSNNGWLEGTPKQTTARISRTGLIDLQDK